MTLQIPPAWVDFAKRHRNAWAPLYWNRAPADDPDPPILGDVYYTQSRGRPQYYVVVGISDDGMGVNPWSGAPQRESSVIVTKLTGDPKKAAEKWPWHAYRGSHTVQRSALDLPVWSGAQAAALYDVYVDKLRYYQGDEAQPLPFQQVEQIFEPPPKLAENDALPAPREWEVDEFEAELSAADEEHDEGETPAGEGFYADVTIRHIADEGTVALYDRQADRKRARDKSVYHVLRQYGFVIVPSEGHIMRRTNSVGYPRSVLDLEPGRANSLKYQLNARGYSVAFDFSSMPLEEAVEVRRGYLRGRAERFERRAERQRVEAGAQRAYAEGRAERAAETIDAEGYYPTPREIATNAAQALAPDPGMTVLDPSAGKGDLLNAAQIATRVRDRGLEGGGPTRSAFDAVEIDPRLQPLIADQGYAVVGADIFDPYFQPGTLYDRILMNPPYERAASIDHTVRAWEFLKPGGRLVAVLPEGIWTREDRKHAQFRAWFQQFRHRDEPQRPARFGRADGIRTRLLILDKPADAPFVAGSPATLETIARARAQVGAVARGGLLGMAERMSEGIPLGQPIMRGTKSGKAHERALAKMKRAQEKARELMEAAGYSQHLADYLHRAADAGGKGFSYERGMTPEEVARQRSREQAARTKAAREAERERKATQTLTLRDQMLAVLRKRKPYGADKVSKGYTRPREVAASFGWFVDEVFTGFGGATPGMRILNVRLAWPADESQITASLYHHYGYSRGDAPILTAELPPTVEAVEAWLLQALRPEAGRLTTRAAFDR
jgi:hypothetical protein